VDPFEHRNDETKELEKCRIFVLMHVQNRGLEPIEIDMQTVWIEHRKGIENIDNRYGLTSHMVLIFSNVPL
jgi:hypothetical protein